VWSLSDALLAASGHVLVVGHPSLEEAGETGRRVKALLARDWGIEHATLELECEDCAVDVDPCALPEPEAQVRHVGHHH